MSTGGIEAWILLRVQPRSSVPIFSFGSIDSELFVALVSPGEIPQLPILLNEKSGLPSKAC